jgi:hypothetical protein
MGHKFDQYHFISGIGSSLFHLMKWILSILHEKCYFFYYNSSPIQLFLYLFFFFKSIGVLERKSCWTRDEKSWRNNMSLFKLFSKNKIPLIPTFRGGFGRFPFGKKGGRAILSFSFFFLFFFFFSFLVFPSLSLLFLIYKGIFVL